jgi:hypothetical protein
MEKIVKSLDSLVKDYVANFKMGYPFLYLSGFSEEEQKNLIIESLKTNKPIKIKLIENVVV